MKPKQKTIKSIPQGSGENCGRSLKIRHSFPGPFSVKTSNNPSRMSARIATAVNVVKWAQKSPSRKKRDNQSSGRTFNLVYPCAKDVISALGGYQLLQAWVVMVVTPVLLRHQCGNAAHDFICIFLVLLFPLLGADRFQIECRSKTDAQFWSL